MGIYNLTHQSSGSAKSYLCCLIIIFIAAIPISCNNSGLDSATSPQIETTNPDDGAENVVVNATLTATFSKDMDSTTITDNSFLVFQDTTAIPGTVSYNNGDSTATFVPSINLSSNSQTTAVITTGVQDNTGNSLQNDFEWHFTTGEESNTNPPQISSTDPSSNAENISVHTDIVATFDKAMDPSSINSTTFLLEIDNSNHPGSIEYSGTSATFTPDDSLEHEGTYTVTITEEAQDLSGNNLEGDYSWTFFTEEGEDIDDVPPQIDATDPNDDAEEIATGTSVSATFSEEMDDETIHPGSFILSEEDSDNIVDGTVSYSDQTALFESNEELRNGTEYSAVITTDAEDLAGNSLAEDYQWNFTTEEDNTPPEVVETFPEHEEEDVEEDITITATFNEPMEPDTFSEETFIVELERFGPDLQIAGTIEYSERTVSFTPDEELEEERDYEVIITTDVTDLAGNELEEEHEWEFEVEDD